MRKMNSKFTFSNLSEPGAKLVNKDYFACVELDDYACYVVADSLDAERDYQSAELAVQSILEQFTDHPTMKKSDLKKYVRKANAELIAKNGALSLQASIMIVVTDYMKIRYIGVGNTRFYMIREDHFLYISKDQSYAQQLYESNQIPKDIVEQHEERNNLYSYLGKEQGLHINVSKKIKLIDGDSFLIVSRGIWEQLSDGEILDSTDGAKEPQEVIDAIEDLVLTKQVTNLDNYTAAAIFIDKTYKKPPKKVNVKKVLMVVIPILLVVITIIVIWIIQYKKNQTGMIQAINNASEYLAYDNLEKAKEEYNTASQLADKIKKDKKAKEYKQIYYYLDQITQADEALDQGKYAEAKKAYQDVYEKTKEQGSLAKDYIEQQMLKAQGYIDVYDLLEDGDSMLSKGDSETAKEKYEAAKEKASSLFFDEGRQEAQDKLKELEEEETNRKEEEAAKEEEEQAKEEEKAAQEKAEAEEKAAKEEEEQKAMEEEQKALEEEQKAIEEAKKAQKENALSYESKGNDAFTMEDYETAIMYYETAKEEYIELEMTERSNAVSSKITLAEKKMKENEESISEAKVYEKSANALVKNNQYAEAKLLYQMALEIYEECGQDEKIETISDKIDSIDQIIANE